MIQEDYCNFELAKMLKEKGFPQEKDKGYIPMGDGKYTQMVNIQVKDWDNPDVISAVSLYKAMKWLREVYGLVVNIQLGWFAGYYGYEANIMRCTFVAPPVEQNFKWLHSVRDNSFERTIELAIKYCLKNLPSSKLEPNFRDLEEDLPLELFTLEERNKALELGKESKLKAVKYLCSLKSDLGLKLSKTYWDLYLD